LTESDRYDGYKPISDYAVIGDCHSAALVARDGSIDFCCLPHFDSGAVFCRILDKDKGGYFQVKPASGRESRREYLENTNVLVTTFQADGGTMQLTDLMPLREVAENEKGQDVDAYHQIIRRIECTEGAVEVEVALKATFDFARAKCKADLREGKGAIIAGESEFLAFAFTGKMYKDGDALRGTIRLKKGELADIILSYARSEADAERMLADDQVDKRIEETLSYWRDWAATCRYDGPYRKEVIRSALVLKLMTFEPSGAIVAAPTTSLPERIGGERNWDYRFTWIRDGTFTLLALLRLGYTGEARDFMNFIASICALHAKQQSQMQIMYGINGEVQLTERTLDHLEGYRGSRPVRIGNAAYSQSQLDIYGEVLDCAYTFYRHGGFGERGRDMTDEMWQILRGTVEYAAAHWRDKDAGIWEVRGRHRHFVYSKVMCWVALDRGIKLAKDLRRDADRKRWRAVRNEIRDSILAEGFNERVGAFTQSYGSNALDAATLRIPLVKFLPAKDEKMRATIEAVKERLTRNGLVYRYLRMEDGLSGSESTFSICTFWLIHCLALMGRAEEAHRWFGRMLTYANDVGLYSEGIECATGSQLGNFPQGFTHIALINAAADLAGQEGAQEQ
jgi:GH15 family glucan-1,4-alpha-glucosidase